MVLLNRNYLKDLYENGRIENLTTIDLRDSSIDEIDADTFKGLVKLDRLWLHDNEIEELDARLFEELVNLKVLYLQFNKLTTLVPNVFKGLVKLETLSLRDNQIENIQPNAFDDLANLKVLNLYNNKLKRIDAHTFRGLMRLERLELQNNEIGEIDNKSFESLLNLKWLRLFNNKLKRLDRSCFVPFKSIEVIELYDNKNLEALSFLNPSTKYTYDDRKLGENGYLSNWNEFLEQFFYSISDNVSSLVTYVDPFIGQLFKQRYEVIKRIGKGAFGSVYLVNDKDTDIKKIQQKAMKIMDRLDPTTDNELELFCEIVHQNIVKYFDHFHMLIGEDNQTFLITEYCQNGNLGSRIDKLRNAKESFSEQQILKWIYQATKALDYLHSKKPPIIHRDIKPPNMLLTANDEIKLTDMGTAKLMDKSHASSLHGTCCYVSTEMFRAQYEEVKYYPNTDVWSLGCVLYELKFLTKAFPHGQRGNPPIPSDLGKAGLFSSILSEMFQKNHLIRITSRGLLVELEKLLNREVA